MTNSKVPVSELRRTCSMRLRARSILLILLSAFLSLISYRVLSDMQAMDSFKDVFNLEEKRSLSKQSSFPMRSNLGIEEATLKVTQMKRDVEVNKEKEFKIIRPFNFPQPAFSRPAQVLLRSRWVTDLQDILRNAKGREISVVTSSKEHTAVLLNWLIAARLKIADPVEDIMVISMDAKLHSTLITRGIPSLYVNKEMVVNPKVSVPRVFSQVHVVRMAVLRLMNHYGYDVINYDCDAVLLKNPQPIFDKYKKFDLIGTFGKGPDVLYKKWGVCLNTGVMVMRATKNMEYFWKEIPYGRDPPITDDQNSINYNLEHMGIRWTNYNKTERIETRRRDILGQVMLSGLSTGIKRYLNVMLMPYTTVCRHVCDPNKRDSYYVWHALAIRTERTVANKKSQASVGGAWHLRDDWEALSSLNPDLKGNDWLNLIAT